MENRDCIVCGTPLICKKKTAIYCSKRCKTKAKRKRHRYPHKRNAAYCARKYVRERARRKLKYATDPIWRAKQLAKKAKSLANRRVRRQSTRHCTVCGHNLNSAHGNRKYCSPVCALEVVPQYYERWKEKRIPWRVWETPRIWSSEEWQRHKRDLKREYRETHPDTQKKQREEYRQMRLQTAIAVCELLGYHVTAFGTNRDRLRGMTAIEVLQLEGINIDEYLSGLVK